MCHQGFFSGKRESARAYPHSEGVDRQRRKMMLSRHCGNTDVSFAPGMAGDDILWLTKYDQGGYSENRRKGMSAVHTRMDYFYYYFSRRAGMP